VDLDHGKSRSRLPGRVVGSLSGDVNPSLRCVHDDLVTGGRIHTERAATVCFSVGDDSVLQDRQTDLWRLVNPSLVDSTHK